MLSSEIDDLFAEWLKQYFGEHGQKKLGNQQLEDLKRAYRAGHLDAHTEMRLTSDD
jgi:hypothetical protein